MSKLSNLLNHRQNAVDKVKITAKNLYRAQKIYDFFTQKHRKALYDYRYIDRRYMEEKVRIRETKKMKKKASRVTKSPTALDKAMKAIKKLPRELQEKIIKEMGENYGTK